MRFKPVPSPQGSIGGLSPSKFKYEALQVSGDFNKFSECQDPAQMQSPLLKTFWWPFCFKFHILSQDSFVAFDYISSISSLKK